MQKILPPAVNWYHGQLADASGPWLAYGAGPRVVVMDSRGLQPVVGVWDIHSDNVTSVSLQAGASAGMGASGSADKSVAVWELLTGSGVRRHRGVCWRRFFVLSRGPTGRELRQVHKGDVTAVQWACNGSAVYSVDTHGLLVHWRQSAPDETFAHTPVAEAASALAAAPHDPALLAIG